MIGGLDVGVELAGLDVLEGDLSSLRAEDPDAAGESLREVATFVSEKLATIQGVLSTGTHFMLKPYKEQGVLMHKEHDEERLAVSP